MGEIGECEQASQAGGNMNSLRTGIKLAAGQQPGNSRGVALSARARNLAQTCWRHLLSALERPSDVPNVFWNILARKVHLGEYLALTGHRRWLKELGIAQAMWVLKVKDFGPFIVESDLEGNSLFELSNREINKNLADLYKGLPQPALRRFGEITDRSDEVL